MVAIVVLLFAASPLVEAKGPVSEVDMANNQCNVSASPTTCGGGFTPTQTFKANLTSGELVTVFFMYLYGNNGSASLSFYDSLGNVPVMVTSQCSASSPIACTGAGFFLVSNGGSDDILFTVTGGTTGEIWYNAEIWQGQFKSPTYTGTSSYCATGCTGNLSLGPISYGAGEPVVAASAYVGFYPNTPATWQPGYPFTYSLTDFSSSGGDSILWMASTSVMSSYSFLASTSPTPLVWAGSAEVIN